MNSLVVFVTYIADAIADVLSSIGNSVREYVEASDDRDPDKDRKPGKMTRAKSWIARKFRR